MDKLPEMLEFIWSHGWLAVLAIILILIIHDPDRAEKIKELFFLPVFRILKRGSRQYMAAKVGYASTQFLKKELLSLLPSAENVKIQIKWVKNQADPVLSEDGTLVLCMRETNDQTRNILAAVQAALPRVVCPTLRPHVEQELEDAIDLALLQRLSSLLGRHAKPVFQKYFLGERSDENRKLQPLFEKLVELDAHGTFITIFLEELTELGEQLFSAADRSDQTSEIVYFLDFLMVEARRKEHEEIKLDYFSPTFSVGIIILAMSEKIQREGVIPYVNRIDQKVRQGCDSIYIIAYQQSSHFFDKLLQVLNGDNRLTLAKVSTPKVHNRIKNHHEQWKIAQFRRNRLFSDTDFAERITANNLIPGSRVNGQVMDVSPTQAFVDVHGLNAVILRSNCGWQRIKDCRDVLSNGERRLFILTSVDSEKGSLVLSLLFPENDPWSKDKIPVVGEKIHVQVHSCDGANYFCQTTDGIEVILPRTEISWTDHVNPEDISLIGQAVDLVIIEKNDDERILKGSARQQIEDPWPSIKESLPKGTQLRGKVLEVKTDRIRIRLPNGLEGILPDVSLRLAGHELADFVQTVVVGQGLDVVINKVSATKRRISLDLVRNLSK